MKNNILAVLLCLCGAAAMQSCNEPKRDANAETLFAGKAEIVCDEEIAPLIQTAIIGFDSANASAVVTLKPATSRTAYADLLGGSARLIVVARPYLYDEDSLMKKFGVVAHKDFHVATDALVFFANKQFPTDTLPAAALKAYFSNATPLSSSLPFLKNAPQFYAPQPSSSVTANLVRYCGNGRTIKEKTISRYFSSGDSVRAAVQQNTNAIGVGLLSQLCNDTARFKMLRIGYTDSTGAYTKLTVHQSTVYRNMYPYPVRITALLKEDLRNFPFGVASYLATEAKPQRSFLTNGIVPAYAKIRLLEEE
ncbi:MAG: substrate-binding domain-containing protein [Candidatus Kapabacteria bacterium]|nr:substrate-binding domain-containing protein [Candidatus Kapabacteria bacterium]